MRYTCVRVCGRLLYVCVCMCMRTGACMHARMFGPVPFHHDLSLSLSFCLSLSLSRCLSVRLSLSLSLSAAFGQMGKQGEHTHTHTRTHIHTHTHTHTLTHTNTHTHTLELGSRGFWGQGLVPKLDKQVFPAACLASKVASNSASGTKARISQQITIIASTESIP